MNKRAYIYARVSSVGERQSNERQIADLTQYAKSNGYHIEKVFEEKATGAKDDRPILAECLKTLQTGDTLLISEISRLGRSVRKIINTVDDLTKAKVDVYMFDFGIHTLTNNGEENPIAKMIVTIFGLGAEMERKTIVNRLNSGRELAKAKGVKMGRPAGVRMSSKEFLQKHKDVVKNLRKGYTMKDTATICKVSISTVQRVKKCLKEE